MKRDLHTHYIQPQGQDLGRYLRSCWKQWDLIWLFARRDLKIKYSQTWLGISWTLLQPIASVLLYALIFSSLFGHTIDAAKYLLHLCTGVVAWSLFHYVAQQSSTALQQQQALLQKVVFPRLLLLLSKAWIGLLDFTLAFLVLCIFLILNGHIPTFHYLSLPLAAAVLLVQGLCVGVWFSVLSIVRRDLQHALPIVLHILLWLSPVFYEYAQLQGSVSTLLTYNPLSEPLALFRWGLLGGQTDFPAYMGIRTVGVTFCLFGGIILLKRAEKNLADVL